MVPTIVMSGSFCLNSVILVITGEFNCDSVCIYCEYMGTLSAPYTDMKGGHAGYHSNSGYYGYCNQVIT